MIKKIVVGELETNCYVLFDNTEAVIIDPGAEPEKIIKFIETEKIKPIAIINTHGHADHIGGNKGVKNKYDVPIMIHYFDAPLLTDYAKNLSIFYNSFITSPSADKLLEEGDVLKCGKLTLKIIHTPGHTRGSISISCKDFIFTGDTLFCGSVGRWDLYGGNEFMLMESIKKLLKYDKITRILPGHGNECNIGNELIHNPYCKPC